MTSNVHTVSTHLQRLSAAVVVVGCLSACSGVGEHRFEAKVEAKPLISTVLLSGTVRTGEAVELLAPMIDMWPIPIQTIVEDGTPVTAGQAIAEFDSTNLASGLQASRDRVVEAETSLLTTRARVEAEEADAQFEVESKRLALEKARLDADVPKELKSEREYQDLQLTLRRAELEHKTATDKLESQRAKAVAEVGIAQVELDKARVEVSRTEQALDVVVLNAPHDGVVEIAYNRDEGRPYRSGDNARPGLPVARFPDYNTLRVEASLFDVDQGQVEVGSEAVVVLDAYPDRNFEAVVTDIQEIAQEVSSRSSRRVFRMLVALLEPDAEIMKVGMSARVEITSVIAEWQGQPTLVVPRAALDFDPQAIAGVTQSVEAQLGQPDATIIASLRTPQGSIAAEVGRCSRCECLVTGIDVGKTVLVTESAAGQSVSSGMSTCLSPAQEQASE